MHVEHNIIIIDVPKRIKNTMLFTLKRLYIVIMIKMILYLHEFNLKLQNLFSI